MKVKIGEYTILSDEKGKEWKKNEKKQDKNDWNPDVKKQPKVDKSKIKAKVKEIFKHAGSKGTGAGGNSPALRKFINDINNPQLDWRKLLQKYIVQANEEVTMYKIPNRRFVSDDIYLPGLKGKEEGSGIVVIAVDTSGSIGQDEYISFLSQVKAILKGFGPSECFIIYCSDGMEPPSGDIDHLKSPAQKLDAKKMQSTGGNDCGFDPPFEWTEKNIIKKGLELSVFIYFTDGGASYPSKPKWHKKVIWAMTTGAKAPFGKVMKIPLDKIMKDKTSLF